jgi:hypothetical protein
MFYQITAFINIIFDIYFYTYIIIYILYVYNDISVEICIKYNINKHLASQLVYYI